MLDPDISTTDALRLLSVVDRDDRSGPGGWTRRGFLQAIGAGVIGGAALGTLGEMLVPGDLRDAFAAAPIGPTDGILVTVMLYGGNDGLNTVIPYGNGLYYSQRANIAVPAAQVLPLDGQVGLHPRLPYLKSLYDQGQVAVVQGVGYPNPDLSHFTSMGTWMSARYGLGAATSGWIGRWLDGLSPAAAELAVATIDSSVALHLQGHQRRAVAISPYGDMFGSTSTAPDLRLYAGVSSMAAPAGRGQFHDMFASTMKTQIAMAQQVAPVFVQALPNAELVKKMTIAARLVNANIGLRVIDVSLDGFDTHEGQTSRHPDLLGQINDAIASFYATLSPTFRDRVTIMTMSEFGRTSYSNASSGTDHGTASPMFVLGTQVRGGLYGQAPSLAVTDRWSRLQHTVDFRSVIGSVIDGWMGGGASTILNGTGENLGLFRNAPLPLPAGPVVVLPPALASGLVSTSPVRVFDTRDGTGGRRGALGAGATWRFPLAGRFGIPSDAVAVAINLTAVDATQSTYVTVYPSGEARPISSNLNPVPGAATPNLVIARLGVGGSIELFNNSGAVHLVGDVVGWFTASSTVGLRPLTPARLADTRDGTGVVPGPLGPGQSIDIEVVGRGGVPVGATAVALNVTVVEPSAPSFLTVWPSGQARPLASSVNMGTGQTVANMVLAQVGANGKVSIFNNTGSSHVVVDVLSAFTPGAGSRFVAVSPSRVLDTREGNGSPMGRLGSGSLTLPLVGRGGVPAGATAVLLNVTAVVPSAPTYITVFSTDVARPLASNVNASAGQVVPNMVIARLGPDGAASVFNSSGDTDVIADVMGYFVG
ncbi:MAG: DUF1501 domain-containing protein [Ilumatobacteraceae bacterium]